MNLLFKDNKDLIKFLPMLDADITFKRLKQDLTIATEDVVKIIGEDLYIKVYDSFITEIKTETQQQLIDIIAYPIAVDAYRKYIIQNDVAHTNEGRKARLNEFEKMPFEWMIERDNEASERKYYKGLDRIIEYLDAKNPFDWKKSNQYKNTFTTLFRTTDEFNEYFLIDSRFLLMKLTPGILKCINNEIIPRISKSSFDDILDKNKNESTTQDVVLYSKIKEACVYYAMNWGLLRMSATLFPVGVLQTYLDQKNKVPAKNEVGVIAKYFENDFKNVLIEIENNLSPKPTNIGYIDLNELLDINDDDKFISIC